MSHSSLVTELRSQSRPKIAVLRALQLGDLLCSVPAIRAIKAALPHSEITLLGLPWAKWLVERFPYFDRFVHFPGFPGLPEQPAEPRTIVEFLAAMQEERFDLALQMQGSGSFVNPLTVLLGAQRTAGYFLPDGYCPDTETFIPYPEGRQEIRRHLALTKHLGFPTRGEELEYPLTSADRRAAERLRGRHGLVPRQYILIHPGARAERRQWGAENFATVADSLAAEGYRIAVTGIPGEDRLVRAVQERMKAESVSLLGETDLGSLGALLADAAMLVSNDTGPSHIAAALKVPSVVVSGDPEWERWAPLDRQLHKVIPMPEATAAAVLAQATALREAINP